MVICATRNSYNCMQFAEDLRRHLSIRKRRQWLYHVHCTDRRVNGHGLVFHRFPLHNNELRGKWEIARKRADFKATVFSVEITLHRWATIYGFNSSKR